MNEKEKSIVKQELWALVAQDACASKHSIEIASKIFKCVLKEECDDMTPNKRKVIEEMQLQWNFVKTIHDDLVAIAAKLGKTDILPAVPDLRIDAGLWSICDSGASDALYETIDKISDFQTAMQECVFKLQEMCE